MTTSKISIEEWRGLKKKRGRYRVAPKSERTVDGIVFHSRAEASHYRELLELQRQGHVIRILRQVPLHLPGGVVYRLDFLVFWAPTFEFPDEEDDGYEPALLTFEDVKGHRSAMYTLKKRQVEALYGIRIDEIAAESRRRRRKAKR
jgi:hypothetical protein